MSESPEYRTLYSREAKSEQWEYRIEQAVPEPVLRGGEQIATA